MGIMGRENGDQYQAIISRMGLLLARAPAPPLAARSLLCRNAGEGSVRRTWELRAQMSGSTPRQCVVS
jgi:hypothetical protein